ncbi:MAG: PhoX family protein [Bacteriovoracaceae bacterium]
MKRRDFLQFLGASGIMATLPSDLLAKAKKSPPLPSLSPGKGDELLTADGLNYKMLIRWGDPLTSSTKFGFNNDYIAFHKLATDRAILWVNHEYVDSRYINGEARTKENVDLEMKEVGGSLFEIQRKNGQWEMIPNSKYNRRLDANTKIPFAWDKPIAGQNFGLGTGANCAGGFTPWGTILTAEENYDMFWGDRDRKGKKIQESWMKWDQFYPRAPEHYGWIVEVNPETGDSKKLISLGRCAHECAAVTKAKNGKVVAYTGDDTINEHLYKFISDSDNSLERGKIYVANLEKGQWISLQIDEQPELKKNFKDQTDVLIYMREAAKMVGATPLDRPEDIEFDPLTGNVFVSLTNNKPAGNYYGKILKIVEDDKASLTFKHETYFAGGKDSHIACPDNLVFDPKGNLWFTSDMADKDMHIGPYEGFGNNGLFVFIRSGKQAGQVIRVAQAPTDAEFTGPCFSPDYKTLFLSVQHPGEGGTPEKPTSHWPDGGIPKSSVVTLQGPLLDRIVQGNT